MASPEEEGAVGRAGETAESRCVGPLLASRPSAATLLPPKAAVSRAREPPLRRRGAAGAETAAKSLSRSRGTFRNKALRLCSSSTCSPSSSRRFPTALARAASRSPAPLAAALSSLSIPTRRLHPHPRRPPKSNPALAGHLHRVPPPKTRILAVNVSSPRCRSSCATEAPP